jgi:hypothetical protein
VRRAPVLLTCAGCRAKRGKLTVLAANPLSCGDSISWHFPEGGGGFLTIQVEGFHLRARTRFWPCQDQIMSLTVLHVSSSLESGSLTVHSTSRSAPMPDQSGCVYSRANVFTCPIIPIGELAGETSAH